MEKNIDNNFDESLYNELLLKESILIPPDKFNNKINFFIEESLKNKIEEKCISDGYVKKDSINIIKKSTGNLKGSQFNGYINYDLIYKASICNPKSGSIIKCKVKLINNKLGLLGNNGPLVIIVGKQLHNNPELLDEINIGDVIDIKVIESKFCLNDHEIRILGKLNIDTDNISKKNNDIDIDDLNEIDNEEVSDSENISNKNIDNIDLESLDDLSSDDDLDNEDMEDDIEDEMGDEMDEMDEMDENLSDIDNLEDAVEDNIDDEQDNDEVQDNDDEENEDTYS